MNSALTYFLKHVLVCFGLVHFSALKVHLRFASGSIQVHFRFTSGSVQVHFGLTSQNGTGKMLSETTVEWMACLFPIAISVESSKKSQKCAYKHLAN